MQVRHIVLKGVFSASGHDELHAAFIKKSTAVEVLKQYVPNPAERRHRYKVIKLERTGEFYQREFPEIEVLTGKDAVTDHRLRKEARKRKHDGGYGARRGCVQTIPVRVRLLGMLRTRHWRVHLSRLSLPRPEEAMSIQTEAEVDLSLLLGDDDDNHLICCMSDDESAAMCGEDITDHDYYNIDDDFVPTCTGCIVADETNMCKIGGYCPPIDG